MQNMKFDQLNETDKHPYTIDRKEDFDSIDQKPIEMFCPYDILIHQHNTSKSNHMDNPIEISEAYCT